LRGTSLSAARIASMIPVKAASFGRPTGFERRYPGGAE
jgi:hypothetical protein